MDHLILEALLAELLRPVLRERAGLRLDQRLRDLEGILLDDLVHEITAELAIHFLGAVQKDALLDLLAKVREIVMPHLLGELRTRDRVVRRHHRIIGGQARLQHLIG